MIMLARLSLFPIALLQFSIPILPQLGLGQDIGTRALKDGIPPELPPGIFFAIWGMIFLAYLVYAVKAVIRPNHLSDALALPLALAGTGNVVWMIAAQMVGSVTLNALILGPLLASAWWAAWILDRAGGFNQTVSRLVLCLLVGLLSGWLTVAVGISLPPVLRALMDFQPTDHVWLSFWTVMLPAAGLAVGFSQFVSRSLWYFVALVWGLSGIVVNTWFRLELHALSIAGTAMIILILFIRGRYPSRTTRPQLS